MHSANVVSKWYDLALVDTGSLVRHEHHDHVKVKRLHDEIERSGFWTHPIIVDRESRIILDGHHRYQVACRMGLQKVPCAIMDYDSDYISVAGWREHEKIDRCSVRGAALSGQLMPIKTSRHTFAEPVAASAIPLNSLRMQDAAYV